ncbi:hypothetical protein MYOV002v2_p0182 [Vibrio phage 144E46.1]|nr:hypothetical protein MYOV002v2_p0182 [Vibrio phage 144E46.1]
MSKIAILKGTSGVGKGTRVVQLIEFLKTKFKSSTVHYTFEGKRRVLGTVFHDQKILFIGRIVTSNKSGLASWTSMDDMHAIVKNVVNVPAILKPWIDKGYTLVCEGEPMMQSNRWRPLYLNEEFGITEFFFQYYHYAGDRDAYNDRIIGRSGKAAGESGWHREKNYQTEHVKVNEEFTSLGLHSVVCPVSGPAFWEDIEGGKSINLLSKYDALPWLWGVEFLNWMGMDQSDLTGQFRKFATENPTLREINGSNPLAKTKKLW